MLDAAVLLSLSLLTANVSAAVQPAPTDAPPPTAEAPPPAAEGAQVPPSPETAAEQPVAPSPAPAPEPATPATPQDAAAANGWDTEPQPEPAPTPAADPGAVPTVAPMPPPVVPGGTPGGIIKQPAPPPNNDTGIGLIAAAGAVGGVSWLVTAGKMAIVSRACESEDGIGNTISGCIGDTSSLLGLTLLNWVTNATTLGLAPAAGVYRGRYDASRYAFEGRPDTNGKLIAGIGGGILGVGVVAKFGLWIPLFRGFSCADDASYSQCTRRKFVAYFAGTQLASTAMAVGAGMLGYGIAYSKERQSRQRLYFQPTQVRFVPTFSRGMAGMSVAGRF